MPRIQFRGIVRPGARGGALVVLPDRKEYALWVADAKTPEMRTTRVDRAVTMIAEGARLS